MPIWALIVTYKGKQIGWLPNNKKVLMPMNLALTRGKKLKVFTSKNSTREVSGEFVYTALFKFNAKSDFWPAMPLSFDDEKLIRVQVFGGLNREFTAYFNFMSSINYAERVKYSSLFIYPDKKKSRLYREYDYSDEYGDYY